MASLIATHLCRVSNRWGPVTVWWFIIDQISYFFLFCGDTPNPLFWRVFSEEGGIFLLCPLNSLYTYLVDTMSQESWLVLTTIRENHMVHQCMIKVLVYASVCLCISVCIVYHYMYWYVFGQARQWLWSDSGGKGTGQALSPGRDLQLVGIMHRK